MRIVRGVSLVSLTSIFRKKILCSLCTASLILSDTPSSALCATNDQQGQGVGRALLDALLARASADDELHQLTLSVTASNAAAVRLYERAGFVRYGTLPRAIRVGGRYFDKQLMQLTLR